MGGQKTRKKPTRGARRHTCRQTNSDHCKVGEDDELQAALELTQVQFTHEQTWRRNADLLFFMELAEELLPQCILEKIADLHEALPINRYRRARENPPTGADAPNKLGRRKRVLRRLWDELDASEKAIIADELQVF